MNIGTLAGLGPDSTPDSTYVDVKDVPWQPTRFPGIDWKILMGSRRKPASRPC
jgi:hypothetical protein